MPKHLTVWITVNCKILKEMGIPDQLICLLRNLYAGHKATVRTGHGKTDWFQIGKGVRQGCILSLCLFNFYAEYIMRNAGLEEPQAGIKIARRNISNLRNADDTTFMAESEEELKSLLRKVKEEREKVGIWSHNLLSLSPDRICNLILRNKVWQRWWDTPPVIRLLAHQPSLERLVPKLKFQYFGHVMGRADSSGKTLRLGKIEDRRHVL